MNELFIEWQALLDVYQGFVAEDPDLRAVLRLDTGQITCAELAGQDTLAPLAEQNLLVPTPVKGAVLSHKQRVQFVESLCDLELAQRLHQALSGPSPFQAFDALIATVPVEAARWVQEERLGDLATLNAWIRRVGLEPSQPPDQSRKIIEFPKRPPRES
jgi:hypothetical protein